MKVKEDSLKIAVQAQKMMAEIDRDRLRLLQNQAVMNMLAMPIDSLDPHLRDFTKSLQLGEIVKLKERMSKTTPSGPTVNNQPTTATRITLPVHPPGEFREVEEEED